MYTSLLSAALLVPALVAAVPTPAADAAIHCNRGVTVFETRGSGEPLDNTLLDIPLKAIMQAVPYSASQRNPYPAAEGVESSKSGITNLTAMTSAYVDACPSSSIMLLGYSQGALVTRLAWTGVEGMVAALPDKVKKNVVSIVLYGDPLHQGNESYDRDTCTQDSKWPLPESMAKSFDAYTGIMESYCASGDGFCCKTGDDPTAHRSYFTSNNAQAVSSFVKGNYKRMAASL